MSAYDGEDTWPLSKPVYRQSRARTASGARLRGVQATIISLLYLLPSLVAFAIFVFYPVLKSIWISLHADNPFGGTSDIFVGLGQYKNALSSDSYRNSLKVTFLYSLYTVPLGLLAALLLAVMANLRLRAISVFRIAFAITIGVSVGAGAVIFALLVQPERRRAQLLPLQGRHIARSNG